MEEIVIDEATYYRIVSHSRPDETVSETIERMLNEVNDADHSSDYGRFDEQGNELEKAVEESRAGLTDESHEIGEPDL